MIRRSGESADRAHGARLAPQQDRKKAANRSEGAKYGSGAPGQAKLWT